MAYPPAITLRPCTLGGSTALESGTQLTLTAEITASRSLKWGATGWQFPSLTRTVTGSEGGELSFSLPVTDLAGWRLNDDSGSIIDVSTPGSYTHTYTIKLYTLSDGRPIGSRTIGPFVLPTEDLSPIDLDLMLPVGTVAGGAVLVPDTWDAKVAAAEAAAASVSDHGALTGLADDDHPQYHTDARGDARYVKTEAVGGLLAPLLVGATAVIAGTTPIALDVWGGYTWGAYGSSIYRSSDNGETWALYATAAAPSILRLLPTSDGEVVVCDAAAIRKSTGWSTGSPTWTTKVAANGTCQFQSWGFDGDSAGSRFIATDYSSTRADSRYVRMSLDAGDTWSIVYDSVAVHGATLANASHMHGVCRDDWGDRWYLSEGHDDGGAVGDIAGIYCSEDDGATWTRAEGMRSNPAPTVLVATADGLVCGSDSNEAGLFGVERRDAPAQEQLVNTWRWRTGRAGVIGFGKRGYRQPGTGQVYVAFTSVFADVAPVIAAGTPTSGALVYTWPGAYLANDFLDSVVLPSAGRLLAYGYIDGGASRYIIKAHPGSPGARSVSTVDTGGALGGSAVSGDSMALGPRATAGETPRATAVGIGATASTTQDGTAVGYVATAGQQATALGSGATAANYGTAVGKGATTNVEGVAVGAGAQNTSTGATAVGRNSTAGNAGTAVGQQSKASGGSSLALGYGASATHTFAVSLGGASTSSHQVQAGARHIELKEVVATPAVAPVDSARLYLRDNGSGKTQLVIQFPSGAAQVIATEP